MPKSATADNLLTDAIRGTDKELFAAALEDEEPDDTEDRSLEDMVDDTEGDADGEGDQDQGDEVEGKTGDKVEGEGDDEPEGDGKAGEQQAKPTEGDKTGERRGDPAVALRDERSRRQAAEAERDRLRGENEETRRRLDALTQPAKPAPKAEEPDPIVDPQGYAQSIREGIRQDLINARVEETFGDAHDAHGERFEAAYGALKGLDPSNPADRATVQNITRAPNPGKALMKWHGQREALREVGDDPAAYRTKVRSELLADPAVRKQLLDDLRSEARGGGGKGPNTITRIPPSLNSASGQSGRTSRRNEPMDDSDSAVFADATGE